MSEFTKDTPLQLVTAYKDLRASIIEQQKYVQEINELMEDWRQNSEPGSEVNLFVKYMLSLDDDTLGFVVDTMTNDKAGIARPLDASTCNPPCGGPGSTPNGSWVCRGSQCLWIPEIG